MRRSSTIALSLAAILVAACSEQSPVERGVYVLRTVGDSTLPFVNYDGGSYRFIALADTMDLDGKGASREVSVTRIETTGAAPSYGAMEVDRRYRMYGDTIVFISGCLSDSTCAAQRAGYKLVSGGLGTFALSPV